MRQRNKKLKVLTGIVTAGVIGLSSLGYGFNCAINSMKVSEKLDPLRERFVEETRRGPDSIDRNGIMNYGLRLRNIVAERDSILEKYHSLGVGWYDRREGEADVSDFVFCYDPFLDVEEK